MNLGKRLKSVTSYALSIAVVVLLVGVIGCKSKKPVVVETTKEQVIKVDNKLVQAKASLNNLLSPGCNKTLEEKEQILAGIKAKNINDPEVQSLIKQLEDKITKEKEAIRIAKERAAEAAKPENKLKNYFDKIANAPSDGAANQLIEKALGMFTSDQSNVLVIIAEEGGMKDYDKPTKIRKYLNYLKTTKNNINKIDEIKWSGDKIKTLILRKVR